MAEDVKIVNDSTECFSQYRVQKGGQRMQVY